MTFRSAVRGYSLRDCSARPEPRVFEEKSKEKKQVKEKNTLLSHSDVQSSLWRMVYGRINFGGGVNAYLGSLSSDAFGRRCDYVLRGTRTGVIEVITIDDRKIQVVGLLI